MNPFYCEYQMSVLPYQWQPGKGNALAVAGDDPQCVHVHSHVYMLQLANRVYNDSVKRWLCTSIIVMYSCTTVCMGVCSARA